MLDRELTPEPAQDALDRCTDSSIAESRSWVERLIPFGASNQAGDLSAYVPPEAAEILGRCGQKGIPAVAKNEPLCREIERVLQRIPTRHRAVLADSRWLDRIPDASVHLVVTSPPYWTLKTYPGAAGQLGAAEDYEGFLDELDRVWSHCLRILVPGGRLVIVVGDVCVSRRRYGRHLVFPLHASIQERCRSLGFDNLAPIIWHKIANARFESAGNGSTFLGKPYEPNSIIKNDIEYILFQRKPGGYRQPSSASRVLSVVPESSHREWFQQIWRVGGDSTRNHPAPFPVELAGRLIRMFSFVGDTVMDPFLGTGTTSVAAGRWGRNSIGFEVEPAYFEYATNRLEAAAASWNKNG